MSNATGLAIQYLPLYKMGVKTLYYHNTRDGAADNQSDISAEQKRQRKQSDRPAEVVIEEDDDCAGGACKI